MINAIWNKLSVRENTSIFASFIIHLDMYFKSDNNCEKVIIVYLYTLYILIIIIM